MIFVDITHTLQSDFRTGIQRVVRHILRELSDDADTAFEVQAVVAVSGRFHALNPRGRARLFADGSFCAAAPDAQRSGLRAILARALLAVPSLYERLQQRSAVQLATPILEALVEPAALQPGRGDVVLLLDAFWGGTSAYDAARRAKAQGAKVTCVVYDMIPVTHPALMPLRIQRVYPPRMRRTLALSDLVLAISHDCAAQVAHFMGRAARSTPIVAFQLGHDFSGPALSQIADKTSVPTFVMVGTIEPRKGHAVVLDAFEARWRAGLAGRLVLIGKTGWAEHHLVERIRALETSGAPLIHLSNLGDGDLAQWLAQADATIIASHVEGFGLPLVESLAAGTPVIASDIPVFREIGGDAVLYFQVNDPASLGEAIARMLAEPQYWHDRAAAFQWVDWRASAGQVRDAIKEHAGG